MRDRALLLAFAAMVAFATATRPAAARELVVDLSAPVVKVTTGFAGTDLLLYGAKKDEGNVIVVIRGPAREQVVRQRERVAGVWVNRYSQVFTGVPSFYWVASNRRIDEILDDEARQIHQIGVDELDFKLRDDQEINPDLYEFKEAIKRINQRDGLYGTRTADLIFLSEALFRTKIRFPANVAVGTYGVDVFLVRQGEIVASDTKILNVRKFGAEAWIFDFAHRYAFAYGVIAILIALAAGWLANAAFRKA